jgi:hypothetical protein
MHSCNRNKEVKRSEISLESCDCLQLWMSDRGTEALVLQFSWVCEVVARLGWYSLLFEGCGIT